ncbi:MAG: DUF4105 domain-containing protein [Gemmatimonadota bacterium]
MARSLLPRIATPPLVAAIVGATAVAALPTGAVASPVLSEGAAPSSRSPEVALSRGSRSPNPSPQLSGIASGQPATLPDVPTAYLVTIGRGPAVWERFGHNMIWIHDPARGVSEIYNYGLFSFEQENFLLRFIQGRMEYWMAGEPNVTGLLSAYARTERSVEIQELRLTVEQVTELHEFLEWNELPENRFYPYDYYRDNCSTRVRDALDRVMEGRLGAWARDRPTNQSYRDHTLQLSSGLFWVSIGMHFGLGPSVDDPLSAWDAMFVPMELRDHIRDFPSEPGSSTSMVRRQWVFSPGSIPEAPRETPGWIGGFLAAGILGALFFAGVGPMIGSGPSARPRTSDSREAGGAAPTAASDRPWIRRGFFGVTIPWLLMVGGIGTLIGLLWTLTDHADTHGNVNLLYATPLHLALALLWPLGHGRAWARRTAVRAGVLVAALSLLGVGLEILSIPEQDNAEFIWLLVPANLSMAWALWKGEQGFRDAEDTAEAESPDVDGPRPRRAP